MAFLQKHFLGLGFLFAATLFSFSIAGTARASGQESQQGSASTDRAIESDVVAAITASPVLNVQPITATTVSGVVTLSGSVDDAASKELAETVVAKVEGVGSVVNHLEVVSLGAPASSGPMQDDQQQPPPQPNAQDPPAQQYPSRRPPYSRTPPPPEDQYPSGQADQTQPSQTQPSQTGPVEIPQGTLLMVRLSEPLDTRNLDPGAIFQATSARDIYVAGMLAIPRGATVEGQVVDIQRVKGSLGGKPSLSLKLNSLGMGGRSYPLASDVWVGNGPGKGAYSAGNTIAGAGIGAVIGGIAGGGAGAAVGATLGGATGAAASSASSGPRVVLPPETMLTFHLTAPVTVVPVPYQEAQRLAASPVRHGPYTDRRPGYPPPSAGYGYPYGYPYPYAYGYPYRPYYYPRYRGYYRGRW